MEPSMKLDFNEHFIYTMVSSMKFMAPRMKLDFKEQFFYTMVSDEIDGTEQGA